MKILLPFSWLYGAITDFRNWLYDRHIFHIFRFDRKIISVGNITVGGTGKTPHIEYLIDFFAFQYKIATLSRGYGRKTKGFLIANTDSDARQIGDEPLQLYQKYAPSVVVSVGEERAAAVPELLYQHPEIELILLDDAFQHRAIGATIQILLTDYSRPFYKDTPLPMGRLRERKKGVKRADIIIVSKCPPRISSEEQSQIKAQIAPYNNKSPVFFTSFLYAAPKNIFSREPEASFKKIVLLSAIAQPKHFESAMKEQFEIVAHFIFSDHYFFTEKDLQPALTLLEQHSDIKLLCTEKDAVKIRNILPKYQDRCFSVGIKVCFVEKNSETLFQELITKK